MGHSWDNLQRIGPCRQKPPDQLLGILKYIYLYLVKQRVVKLEARDSLLAAHHSHVLGVFAVGYSPAIRRARCQGGLLAVTVDVVHPNFP